MSISLPIQRESPQEVCLLCDLTILCLFTKSRGHICPRTCSFLHESVHPLGKNWRLSSCKMYHHRLLGLLHEGQGPSLWILKRLMVHKLRHLLCHKRGCDICSTVTYYWITTVAFLAYCLQNWDKQRYAIECPNHNQHVVWTLHQVAESVFGCILQYNYRFVAYCLHNHDEQRDAANWLDCHQDGRISSERLQNPLLVSQIRLQQLLWSCQLLFHYHILAFCFHNCDDTAQCLACHRHDGISSELLHNPIMVAQTRLQQLLESRLLLRH